MKRVNSKIKRDNVYIPTLLNYVTNNKNITNKGINNEIKKDVMNINEETNSKLDNLIGFDDDINETIKIKKEKGLIERTKSSKKILVEGDNRELLRD